VDPEREKRIREETVETFIRVGGPGGQHRNRNETGVRLRHLPTGITVIATESRSRARNRKTAWRRLFDRIAARMACPKRRILTKPSRASEEKRLEEKKRRSLRKRRRRPPKLEE
jgi:protein subunit release factor B